MKTDRTELTRWICISSRSLKATADVLLKREGYPCLENVEQHQGVCSKEGLGRKSGTHSAESTEGDSGHIDRATPRIMKDKQEQQSI
jgi:hypothetical protein